MATPRCTSSLLTALLVVFVSVVCSSSSPALGQSAAEGSSSLQDPDLQGPELEGSDLLYTRRSALLARGLGAQVLNVVDSVRMDMLYMRFPEAESKLYALMEQGGDASVVARHQLMTIAVLRVLFRDRPEDYDRFFEVSDSLRDVVSEKEGDALAAWTRADNELQRSWVWAKRDQNIRAALAANAAWVGMKSAVDRYPSLYDAYLGLGVLHIGLGALPRSYRRFLRVLGYSGTLQEGVRELSLAADSSAWMGIQARFFLSVLDLYGYPSSLEAIPTLESLHASAPDSPLLSLLLADAYLRENRAPDAANVLAVAQDVNRKEGVETLEYLDFFQGEALFRMGDCVAAAPLFRRYLDRHAGVALKARANLSLGLCLELGGQRAAATQYYSEVVAARAFDEDAAASRQAKTLLMAPMGPIDRILLRADQAFQSARPDSAEVLYGQVLQSQAATAAQGGAAAYGMGRSLHVTGRLAAALNWYTIAAREPGDPHAKWAPWSLFHAAEIHEVWDQKGEAVALLDRLLDYPEEYDFRPTLENRARIWRDALLAQ